MHKELKYVLDETRIPKSWYNIAADLPVPPPAVLHPGTKQFDWPLRSRTAVPDGADPAGGLDRALYRNP